MKQKKQIEIIAEIGWNHVGDMSLAKQMIESASKNGATYAKFQSWSVKRLKPDHGTVMVEDKFMKSRTYGV